MGGGDDNHVPYLKGETGGGQKGLEEHRMNREVEESAEAAAGDELAHLRGATDGSHAALQAL